MKSVILLALTIALVAAAPAHQVKDFTYGVSDWISANWNLLLLQIVLPIYASIGYITAFFGASAWFNEQATSLIEDTFVMPAYDAQDFNVFFPMMAASYQAAKDAA